MAFITKSVTKVRFKKPTEGVIFAKNIEGRVPTNITFVAKQKV